MASAETPCSSEEEAGGCLGGRQEKTQKEVADIMGISQSYISRLEKRIMLRLRREISRQIYS